MPAVEVVHAAVWDLIDAMTGVNAYDGEVPATPPLDEDGRVASYAVLFFSPGRRHANAFDAAQRSIEGSFQVTCVGGDPTRALWCVDQVFGALLGAWVSVDGVNRQIRSREDDPGPVREDKNVTPTRHYVPLQFLLQMP